MRDPRATASEAVRLARLGVWQFLTDGEDPTIPIAQAIEERSTQDLARLSEQVSGESWEQLLIGNSPEMRQVHHVIRMIGGRRATVLITGETGTGKELVARALHLAGIRRRGPLVAVNCGALPENLLEAELFGHVRGAFTGAVQNRTGRFEQAQGGTLFLDEIAELPMELQVKLLRVLQEREFQRLGSPETIHADVRVVAATNCDVLQKIQQGRFREDLYYRLNVVPIQLPPLRQRREDIPLLAAHLMAKICRLEEIPVKSFDGECLERVSAYSWPGNVRQLENAIEMAVAMAGSRSLLTPADFPLPVRETRGGNGGRRHSGGVPARGRIRFRAYAGVHRAQHPGTGIAENRRKQEGGGADAPAEAHHAFGQGAQFGARGSVPLSSRAYRKSFAISRLS